MKGNSASRILPEDAALLEEGLSALGLFDERTFALLTRYIEEILLFNPAYGLVKVQHNRELIVKHILDSLAPLGLIRRAFPRAVSAADVGSGAGLPGIPLSICAPDMEFTLVERMGRRAGFLRNTLAVLGLSNVRVEEAEMEKLPAPFRARFNLIVFRAFRPLEPDILKGLFRLLSPGGTLAAYKGRREAVEEEMAALLAAAKKGAGPSVGAWETVPLEVPFLEEERHLLLLRAEGDNRVVQ